MLLMSGSLGPWTHGSSYFFFSFFAEFQTCYCICPGFLVSSKNAVDKLNHTSLNELEARKIHSHKKKAVSNFQI